MFKSLPSLIPILVLGACNLAQAQEWQTPRTAAGHPDLQGVWSNKTLTPLTRPREFEGQLILTPEQASRMESSNQDFLNAEYAASNPDREAGAGAQAGDDGDTNDGYNEFWKDVGTNVLQVGGEYRSSILIEPENGQIPYKGDPRTLFRPEPGAPGRYDGPEGRPLGERCLLSFGSHSGPPMLPVMYNNNYQIVQTPDYVVILTEMVHDARIIRITDEQPRQDMAKWMGDSTGRWQGDTLVVTTEGFNAQQNFRGASDNLKVTERFTRVSASSIRYQFTVQDDTVFSQPFSGEMLFNSRPADQPMYEYACHEGNYALAGILAGARQLEVSEEMTAE